MKMTNKIFTLIFTVLLLFCFVGCQENDDVQSVTSDDEVSSTDNGTSKVPVVIVDNETDDSSSAQSEVDEIIDDWENVVPDIDVEVNSTDKDDSSDTTTSNNSSDDAVSSEKEETESSENQSSDNTSSKEDEVSNPNRPDDGYFDVAV